jgi:hypothetical protein
VQRADRDFALFLLLVGMVAGYIILAGGLLPKARYTNTLGTLLAFASY